MEQANQFSLIFQGYDPAQVDAFISALQAEYLQTTEQYEAISEKFDALLDTCTTLQVENSRLKAENDELYNNCVTLAQSLRTMQEAPAAAQPEVPADLPAETTEEAPAQTADDETSVPTLTDDTLRAQMDALGKLYAAHLHTVFQMALRQSNAYTDTLLHSGEGGSILLEDRSVSELIAASKALYEKIADLSGQSIQNEAETKEETEDPA